MNKGSFLSLILYSLFFILYFIPAPVSARTIFVPKPSITLSATVGEYYLNVSGFISPFASVVLYADGVFYRGTVADKFGNFSLSQMLIRLGFTGFCLEAKDFHNLGDSYTCFKFAPANGDITMRDIFLPPTLALQRSEIAAGGTALAFGYTMPGAVVTLHIKDRTYTVKADSQGYYEFKLENVPAGTYQLFADATYNGRKSESPTRTLTLRALTLWEQFVAFVSKVFKSVKLFLIGIPLGPLWLGLPIIIGIIILIVRIWPEKFTWMYHNRLVVWFATRRGRPLHHAWFVGY